jgi:hypothetical protein
MSHKFWASLAAGGCITGFITQTLPYLQAFALLVSIAAGLKAIFWAAKKVRK